MRGAKSALPPLNDRLVDRVCQNKIVLALFSVVFPRLKDRGKFVATKPHKSHSKVTDQSDACRLL